MKITFAGIDLADFADAQAKSVSINGQIVFEAIDIVLAASKRVFFRGNQLINLSFSVRRQFDSIKECEVFLLTHFALLPKAGLCLISCGTAAGDVTLVYLANAVLAASPQGGYGGVSAEVTYSIIAPTATTDTPPGILAGGEDMIARDSTAIANAAESVAVIFAAPFTAVPIVTASVGKPSGGDNLWATVDQSTVTINGFTAYLSAPAPAGTYKLNWLAIG